MQEVPERVCSIPKKKLMGAGLLEKMFKLFSLRKKQVASKEVGTDSMVGVSVAGKGRLTAGISGPPAPLDRAADHSLGRLV